MYIQENAILEKQISSLTKQEIEEENDLVKQSPNFLLIQTAYPKKSKKEILNKFNAMMTVIKIALEEKSQMNDPQFLDYLKQQNKIKMEANIRASEDRKKKRADELAQRQTPPQIIILREKPTKVNIQPPAPAPATSPVDASATPSPAL